MEAMVKTVSIFLLASIQLCLGEGNIHLLEEEIPKAFQACSNLNNKTNIKYNNGKRERRYDENLKLENGFTSRIDASSKQQINQYNHKRRNSSFKNNINVLNGSDFDYSRYGYGDNGGGLKNSVPQPAIGYENTNVNTIKERKRTKRNEPLLNIDDHDQCLSQCVFANLQVVDAKGIPREAMLWNKIQPSMTSQQSQIIIREQIRACFQELQSESEDNGCLYSNRLERCLTLHFSDRKRNKHAE